MKKADKPISLLLFSLIMAAAMLAGCAVKQEASVQPQASAAPEASKAPEAGMLLAYRIPEDRVLKYRLTVEQEHSMELMRQPRESRIERVLEFSLMTVEAAGDSMPLTATVDRLYLKLETPRGIFDREIGEVVGKSFFMTLSPSGEEADFKMTKAVEYDMQPAGTMNAATDLEAFFPNLPGGELRVGESWPTLEHMPDTAFNSGQKIRMESVHTLEGFETIDGVECVKIRTVMNGILEQVGEKMVRAPDMDAEFEGTGAWFFDAERGLLVRAVMTIRGGGEMQTGGGQGPPARMRQTMTLTTRLLH